MRERSLRSELRLQMSQAKEEMTARVSKYPCTTLSYLMNVHTTLRPLLMIYAV